MHNFNFFEAFRFASNCNTNWCRILGFNSSGIVASILIILKWYFSDRCLWYYCFSRFFYCYHWYFSFNFGDDSRWATINWTCFCAFWDLKTWRFSLALLSMLHHIYSHQNWILRSFIIQPSVTYSSITVASKMKSWEMLPWILLTAFYCLRQENKGI